MSKHKKTKTAAGWAYRGFEIFKNASGNYQTTDGRFRNGSLLGLTERIDDVLDAAAK